MRHMKLYVGGMSCRRCVREVTARLRDVAGVETVTAQAGASEVRLSGSMEVDDVLAAFAGTTYRPRLDTDSDADSDADSDGTAAGQSVS